MDKSLIPLVPAALALAAIIGVLFHKIYPDTDVNAGLGALFVLVALLMVLLLRTGWRALRGGDR